MERPEEKLSKLDVLLCGLAFTSRTETLEDYLKNKANSLTVIAVSSCFLRENLSSCRIYEKGGLVGKFKIPNFRIKDYKWYRQPLILLVFISNWLFIILAAFRLKKRFDLCIGISHSFALVGAIFKKMHFTKRLIYYCGDYYIPNPKLEFNALFIKLINFVDRFTIKSSDYVWDVALNISEYRYKVGKIKKESYKSIVVPLGYGRHLRPAKPVEEFNRWDIGFVGTVTESQGLQLLAEAMPQVLRKLPNLRIKVIGHGPFLAQLKKLVSERQLDRYFTFFGFIKEEEKMLALLSHCAIGVALWNESIDDKNIICADPGKTKLYAFCGLSMIVTRSCNIYQTIQDAKAGIVIGYSINELESAILYLLQDNIRLKEFRANAFNLGAAYVADNIFDNAFNSLGIIHG